MSLNLVIKDVEGERRIAADRLPLRVGTGSDCDPRLPGPGALRVIIAAALAVLIVVSYLLFTAKSVKFEVTPGTADSFSIAGGWFRMPLGDRILLRKGS